MDKTEIRVEGASYVEGESITDTLWVRSNRSWSLEAEENLNPQERTANVHLTIDGETSLYEYQLNKRHSEGIRYFIPGFNYNN